MAASESITDRDGFGHWLSGFTDGEGSFILGFLRRAPYPSCPRASFSIGLRSDDEEILYSIKEFLGVGIICNRHAKPEGERKRQTDYVVSRAIDLENVIVPHFERYPLRAKKARDFSLWRAGVAIIATAQRRPMVLRRFGAARRYTESECVQFQAIDNALRKQRCFESGVIKLPILKSIGVERQRNMFW